MHNILNLWKCFSCDHEFLEEAGVEVDECPSCSAYDCGDEYCQDREIFNMVKEGLETYEAPLPEFDLDSNVLEGVSEPVVEFYGTCKVCEIPLTEEYRHITFCGDCADDTWKVLMSGNKGDGGLLN